MYKTSRMKRLAILFTIFIPLVIVLADGGVLSHYLGFLNKIPLADKVGHFFLYGILTLLLDLALFRSIPGQSPVQLASKTGMILVLLIGLEEFSQQYFSYRTFDPVDLAFSNLGILFFSWVAVKIKK
jgi:VanZ family protein